MCQHVKLLLLGLALVCGLRPVLAGQGDAIRVESAVIATGRAAVARYEDRHLASLGFLDVTKAPYQADPSGKTDATAAIQQAINDARDGNSSACCRPDGISSRIRLKV